MNPSKESNLKNHSKFKVVTVKVYGDRTIIHYHADNFGISDIDQTSVSSSATGPSFELQEDLERVPDEAAEINGATHPEIRVVCGIDGKPVHVFSPREIMLADNFGQLSWVELLHHASQISQQEWVSAKRSRLVADSHEAGAT